MALHQQKELEPQVSAKKKFFQQKQFFKNKKQHQTNFVQKSVPLNKGGGCF